MKGMRIDLSTPGKRYRNNRFLKQEGFIDMLEARENRNIDQLMPFIATIVHRCCGEVKNKTLFLLYLTMMSKMLSRGVNPIWAESELKTLEVAIEKYRRDAKALYSKYQPFGMSTAKMHLLDHVCSNIRRNGGFSTVIVLSSNNIKSPRKSTIERHCEGGHL